MILQIITVLAIVGHSVSQKCLNDQGQSVNWWAILKVPQHSGSSGFGYYDSTYSFIQFKYISSHVDEQFSALARTLQQINTMKLSSIAWNDEKPDGHVSSTSAHSKGVIAFDLSSSTGYLISHSLPKYPAFNNDQVDITIKPSQNVYGQDIFCISLSVYELNLLAFNLMITKPNIYQAHLQNTSATRHLADLAFTKSRRVSEKFMNQSFRPATGAYMTAIFKNGYENCSIFSDGMTELFKANVVAESWGRPLQDPWCSPTYQVTNVLTVSVGSVSWKQTEDHSKWALVGNKYACFGDMNRMTSQWKRGGSFFCMNNAGLALALKRVITSTDKC